MTAWTSTSPPVVRVERAEGAAEAALSFSSTLGLVGVLHDVVRARGQVLCATHSPVLAAMPGATILEVGEYLRHLLAD